MVKPIAATTRSGRRQTTYAPAPAQMTSSSSRPGLMYRSIRRCGARNARANATGPHCRGKLLPE